MRKRRCTGCGYAWLLLLVVGLGGLGGCRGSILRNATDAAVETALEAPAATPTARR